MYKKTVNTQCEVNTESILDQLTLAEIMIYVECKYVRSAVLGCIGAKEA